MIFQFLLIFSLLNISEANPCRGGATLDPSGTTCYLVGTRYLTFSDAEKTCQSHGGYQLAVIENMVDNNFLSKLAYSAGCDTLFLGATDLTPDGSWQWLDGSPMNFVNWAPAPKTGSCAVMRSSDGKWLRDSCDDKQNFICYGPAAGATTKTTKKPHKPKTTTLPVAYSNTQFLFFVGDSDSLGDPTNHTDRAQFYTKERDFMKSVADYLFTHNLYPEDNLACDVFADQSWYGWANFQQQFVDGWSDDQSGFDNEIMKLNFTDNPYQMNNISTAITALNGFHWYPTPSETGYTTLVFFTAHQDFTGVPSLFDPWPYAVSEILVVAMNGSPMQVPYPATKVSISSEFNQSDLKLVTDALKCH